MSNYNLTDNVEDKFEFELRGKKYAMTYPITEEIEKLQETNNKLIEAQKEKEVNKELVAMLGDELEGFIYGFIEPVGHEENIKDVLSKENIRVLRNFNTMIRTELSL
jgi:hypothetical protein